MAKPDAREGAGVLAARLLYDFIETRYRTGARVEQPETKVRKIIGRVRGTSNQRSPGL